MVKVEDPQHLWKNQVNTVWEALGESVTLEGVAVAHAARARDTLATRFRFGSQCHAAR